MSQKPILYSYFRSSASYRVRIALNWKGIDYDYRPVHLVKDGGEHRKQEFLNVYPVGQLPVFVDENVKIGQSMAILDYLDQRWPQRPLFPQVPAMRAKAIELAEVVNSGIQPIQNLSVLQRLENEHGLEKSQISDWCHFWIQKGFVGLEGLLESTSGSYCLGGDPSVADVFLMPQVYNAHRFKVDLNQFPNIQRIEANLKKLDAFDKAKPESQADAPK